MPGHAGAAAMTDKLLVSGGWAWPERSRKAHFFREGRSICRRWLYVGILTRNQNRGNAPGPDDCVVCWRASAVPEPPR